MTVLQLLLAKQSPSHMSGLSFYPKTHWVVFKTPNYAVIKDPINTNISQQGRAYPTSVIKSLF